MSEAAVAQEPAVGRAAASHLSLERADWGPSRDEIDRLCKEGLQTVGVSDLVLLPGASKTSRFDLDRIRFLRDLTANGIAVRWEANHAFEAEWPCFVHIAAPTGPDLSFIRKWRAGHRYGACYWRMGPGYIVVVDRRRSASANQFILDTEPFIRVFTSAASTIETERLEQISAPVLRELEEEGLILSRGGWSVALPYRMKRWPVPFNAI